MIPTPVTSPTITSAELQHLPDILFVSYCFEAFGLNRGIYNTIDQWLYDFGCAHIVHRRHIILAFLEEMQSKFGRDNNGTILRFGKGGLTKQLYDFISSHSFIETETTTKSSSPI